MTYQTTGVAVVALLFFVIRYLNRTDIPKIKGIPEIPGIPIFGNLLQLGEEHAKNAAKWVKQYGPVFQVRLGNRVCSTEEKSMRFTNELSRESSSPIPSTASSIYGLPINPLSSPDLPSTPSIQ